MLIEIVLWILMTLLSIIGLAAVIRGISHIVLCQSIPKNLCTVIMLEGENADIALKSSFEQIVYERSFFGDEDCSVRRLVAVDVGLEAKIREKCRDMCEEMAVDFICGEHLSVWLMSEKNRVE